MAFRKRLGGQSGSVYLAGQTQKLLDIYMWEYEEQQEVLDASIKGEDFKRYTADVGTARVRVQSFVPFPGDHSPLTALMDLALVTSQGGGTPVDFVLDMVDGTGRTVVGQGYITRSQLHVVRDGIITDEIEIQVDGRPTVVN
jgi:hypothetical protein